MRYRKPQFYDNFHCIAGDCPDTCCAGWQILIDQESLEKYSSVNTDFGTRLLNSIDWYQGAFEQYNKRCSFLNDENLCDLYQEMGADALCQTCRMYPRHVEEFEDLREYSLSLSCPEAARIMLSTEEKTKFIETEDTLEEEEDYEDFDLLLFDRLEEARDLIFSMIQNRTLYFSKRMAVLLRFSYEIQEALDKGELFELNLEDCMNRALEKEEWESLEARFNNMKDMAKDLEKLEVLREDWGKELANLQHRLYDKGEVAYKEIQKEFFENLKYAGKEQVWDIWGEQILVFFVYTYFCGGVYDDMIYTKAVLAVFSVLWIREIIMERCYEQGRLPELELVCQAAWQFAREIEHSDENLNLLEEFFDGSERYMPENLIPGIVYHL